MSTWTREKPTEPGEYHVNFAGLSYVGVVFPGGVAYVRGGRTLTIINDSGALWGPPVEHPEPEPRPSDGMTREQLAAEYDLWAVHDGNTPGYGREKARNYGDQAAFWKARAVELGASADEYTASYDAKPKGEPEPPADGRYELESRVEGTRMWYVAAGRVSRSADMPYATAWNETTIDWSRARRLIPADEAAKRIRDTLCRREAYMDAHSQLAKHYRNAEALADEMEGKR